MFGTLPNQSFAWLIAADFVKTMLDLLVTINGNTMPASQLLLWPHFRPATKPIVYNSSFN